MRNSYLAQFNKSGRRPRHDSLTDGQPQPVLLSLVSGDPPLRLVPPRRPEHRDYFKEMIDDILGTR